MTAETVLLPSPEPRQLSLVKLGVVSVLSRGIKGVVFYVVPKTRGGQRGHGHGAQGGLPLGRETQEGRQ